MHLACRAHKTCASPMSFSSCPRACEETGPVRGTKRKRRTSPRTTGNLHPSFLPFTYMDQDLSIKHDLSIIQDLSNIYSTHSHFLL